MEMVVSMQKTPKTGKTLFWVYTSCWNHTTPTTSPVKISMPRPTRTLRRSLQLCVIMRRNNTLNWCKNEFCCSTSAAASLSNQVASRSNTSTSPPGSTSDGCPPAVLPSTIDGSSPVPPPPRDMEWLDPNTFPMPPRDEGRGRGGKEVEEEEEEGKTENPEVPAMAASRSSLSRLAATVRQASSTASGTSCKHLM